MKASDELWAPDRFPPAHRRGAARASTCSPHTRGDHPPASHGHAHRAALRDPTPRDRAHGHGTCSARSPPEVSSSHGATLLDPKGDVLSTGHPLRTNQFRRPHTFQLPCRGKPTSPTPHQSDVTTSRSSLAATTGTPRENPAAITARRSGPVLNEPCRAPSRSAERVRLPGRHVRHHLQLRQDPGPEMNQPTRTGADQAGTGSGVDSYTLERQDASAVFTQMWPRPAGWSRFGCKPRHRRGLRDGARG
jgi:hypothetical protein